MIAQAEGVDTSTATLRGSGLACPSLVETALAYRRAGRSVLPIAPGWKRPSIVSPAGRSTKITWKPFQRTRASVAQIRVWFARGQCLGLGIACGPVSGLTRSRVLYALEVLDFDCRATLDAFLEAAPFQGYSAVLARLLAERTPSDCAHLAYLCAQWGHGEKLAMRPDGCDSHGRPKGQTLIEVLGEGNQVVVSPTPPGIHPDYPERGYELVRGSWEDVPIISTEERHALFTLAQSFDERTGPTTTDHRAARPARSRSTTHPTKSNPKANAASTTKPSSTCCKGEQHPTAGAEPLTSAQVRKLFGDEAVVKRCMAHMGLPEVQPGKEFLCLVHQERRPSAALMAPRTADEQFLYWDFHKHDGRLAWPLGCVYRALRVKGRLELLSRPSLLTWGLCLLVDAGIVPPAHVAAPPLPEDAPQDAVTVYAGFVRLLSVKWLISPGAPSPFSWRFGSAWAGLPERRLQEGMRWLTRHDFLVGAGACSVMGKNTTLFALGTPSQATANVTSPVADP